MVWIFSKPYLLPKTVLLHFLIKEKIIFSWYLYDGVWRLDFTIRNVLIHLFIIRLEVLKGLIIVYTYIKIPIYRNDYILTKGSCFIDTFSKICLFSSIFCHESFIYIILCFLSLFFTEWPHKCKKEISK